MLVLLLFANAGRAGDKSAAAAPQSMCRLVFGTTWSVVTHTNERNTRTKEDLMGHEVV